LASLQKDLEAAKSQEEFNRELKAHAQQATVGARENLSRFLAGSTPAVLAMRV